MESHDIVNEKLEDSDTPGMVVEMDPDEADQAGAFFENALSLDEALEAALDA